MTEENSPLTARLLDEDESEVAGAEAFSPNAKEVADSTIEATVPTSDEWERGEKQPSQCRDWPFGLFFYIQFIAVITLGGYYMRTYFKVENQQEHHDGTNLMTVILPALVSAATALLLIILALVVLYRMGNSFITCSVWTSAIVSFMVGVTALSTGSIFVGCLSLLSALFGCCYAYRVRKRIPFAAANLRAGVASIKSNGGITLISLLFGGLIFGWILLWIVSLAGVMNLKITCNEGENGEICQAQVDQGRWAVLWVFFLFWTQQTFKNVIHTTVAGLVGSWYFDPHEANSFCSPAIFMSLFRSLTYSFGSICLGSLCVAILQTLDWIVNSLRSERRQNRDNDLAVSLLLCCLDCILTLLENIMEYFNKWAFVYVGVYGYPFLTAGKKVMTLFEQRGWSVIINDHLVSHALGLMCFVISLLSGVIPVAVVAAVKEKYQPALFGIGFPIGLLLSMTVMSIIDSAVSTVIVCFAEAPSELERNHSRHSQNMKEAWIKVYDIRF